MTPENNRAGQALDLEALAEKFKVSDRPDDTPYGHYVVQSLIARVRELEARTPAPDAVKLVDGFDHIDVLRRSIKQLVADAINFGKNSTDAGQATHFQKMMVGVNDEIQAQLAALSQPLPVVPKAEGRFEPTIVKQYGYLLSGIRAMCNPESEPMRRLLRQAEDFGDRIQSPAAEPAIGEDLEKRWPDNTLYLGKEIQPFATLLSMFQTDHDEKAGRHCGCKLCKKYDHLDFSLFLPPTDNPAIRAMEAERRAKELGLSAPSPVAKKLAADLKEAERMNSLAQVRIEQLKGWLIDAGIDPLIGPARVEPAIGVRAAERIEWMGDWIQKIRDVAADAMMENKGSTSVRLQRAANGIESIFSSVRQVPPSTPPNPKGRAQEDQVYCHECSDAGGAERDIYHLPPACPPGGTTKERTEEA